MTRLTRRTVMAVAAAAAIAPPAAALGLVEQAPGTTRARRIALVTGHALPVWTIRGTRAGPRALLTGGIHGDERNSVAVVERVVADLDPARLGGSVVAAPILNGPGYAAGTRTFPGSSGPGSSGPGASGGVDLNRIVPGDAASPRLAERYVAALWATLDAAGADLAVDVHTLAGGAAYPLFVFADVRVPGTRRLARLLEPDLVKVDRGEPGSWETALNRAGVPAVTFEVGGAGAVDAELVIRAAAGIANALAGFGLMEGPARLATPFVGNATTTITAATSGPVLEIAPLLAPVEAGRVVARQPGRAYRAARAGRVLATATDPAVRRGDLLVRLLHAETSRRCRDGC